MGEPENPAEKSSLNDWLSGFGRYPAFLVDCGASGSPHDTHLAKIQQLRQW